MTYNTSETKQNSNYVHNQQTYNQYSSVPRTWIKIAQIVGTIFSVLGLILYVHYMQNIYQSLPNNELVKKAVVALLLAIIVYFVWRSIYTAIIIIRLVNHSSDEELCANRYLISALSLSVGGFFTPFLVTSFPNVDTTSTIKPRYFLSKAMGLCTLIGAPIFAITYFSSLLLGINAVDTNDIFNTNSTMGVISITVLVISLITTVLGAITTKLFFSKEVTNDFSNNKNAHLLKIVSTIWMAILTVELVIVILFSIVRLLNAIADLFRAREGAGGALMTFFALLNLLITISYVGMVIYVTSKTITGLWAIDGNVTIKRYEHNNFTKNRLYRENTIV